MRHIRELDGLRAIAVVAVVLFHAEPYGPLKGGFLGVDLFFVLSGFLITSILADDFTTSGRIDLPRFYWRRLCRLIPALSVMLAVYLAVAPLVWPAHPHGRDAAVAALYLSDYSVAIWRIPVFLMHTWSLAIEEHFYLLWPAVLPLLFASRRPVLCLAVAWIAMTLWRTSVPDYLSYYYRFDTHATGLILGALIAFVPKPRVPAVAVAASAFMIGILLAFARFDQSGAFISLAEIASAVLILAAANHPPAPMSAMLNLPSAQALGRWSYGIYLWHYPVAVALRGHLPFAPTAAITLATSVAAAALSFATVERGGRLLRDRVEGRRRVEV